MESMISLPARAHSPKTSKERKVSAKKYSTNKREMKLLAWANEHKSVVQLIDTLKEQVGGPIKEDPISGIISQLCKEGNLVVTGNLTDNGGGAMAMTYRKPTREERIYIRTYMNNAMDLWSGSGKNNPFPSDEKCLKALMRAIDNKKTDVPLGVRVKTGKLGNLLRAQRMGVTFKTFYKNNGIKKMMATYDEFGNLRKREDADDD